MSALDHTDALIFFASVAAVMLGAGGIVGVLIYERAWQRGYWQGKTEGKETRP